MRPWCVALVLLASLALPSSPALAQTACSFSGGFALLAAQIPDRVGNCLDTGTSRPELGDNAIYAGEKFRTSVNL